MLPQKLLGLLRRTSLPLAVALMCGGVLAQSAEESFQAAVEAFRNGDDQAAAEHLKAVLADNPGNDAALEMWNGAEQRLVNEMLLSRGELGALAERFLGLARAARKEFVEDPGNAAEVVDRLLAGDEVARERALLELRAGFGPWAVPALLGPLGDGSSIDNRVLAIQALNRLGGDAVMPLIAALKCDDELTRRNAAAVLGTLRDPRAAPALAFLARDSADTTTAAVAAEALGKLGLSNSDPVQLARQTAEGWFRGDMELTQPYSSAALVWAWEDGKLHGRPVLAGLYPLLAAEQAARLGVEHGAAGELRPILAAIHAAQKAEILAAQKLPSLEGNELLASAAEHLPRLDVELALAGRYRGLGLVTCLAGKRRHPEAARVLAAAMGPSVEERQALQAALNDNDASVAAAASMALARQGDTDPGVVARLAGSLTAEPDRIVAVIGQTGLTGTTAGWQVTGAANPAEGLLRAKMLPPKDVVVVQDGAGGMTLDTLVFGLKNDPRTAQTPIIVVTGDVDGVSSLYGDKVAKIVRSAGFADVAEVAGPRDAIQQEQVDRARLAAEVLAGLPVGMLRAADGQIAEAARTSADPGVLTAVLELASKAGTLGALPRAEQVVVDAGAPSGLKLAALHAAATLWALGNGTSGDREALESALSALTDGDDAMIAVAAGGALGQLRSLAGGGRPVSLR